MTRSSPSSPSGSSIRRGIVGVWGNLLDLVRFLPRFIYSLGIILRGARGDKYRTVTFRNSLATRDAGSAGGVNRGAGEPPGPGPSGRSAVRVARRAAWPRRPRDGPGGPAYSEPA